MCYCVSCTVCAPLLCGCVFVSVCLSCVCLKSLIVVCVVVYVLYEIVCVSSFCDGHCWVTVLFVCLFCFFPNFD